MSGECHDREPSFTDKGRELGEGGCLFGWLSTEQGYALDVGKDGLFRELGSGNWCAAFICPEVRVEAPVAADGAALHPDGEPGAWTFGAGLRNDSGNSNEGFRCQGFDLLCRAASRVLLGLDGFVLVKREVAAESNEFVWLQVRRGSKVVDIAVSASCVTNRDDSLSEC